MDYQEPYRFLFPSDFYICYLVCYLGEVACFETSSFRHTPIYFSSEKYFKYVFKITDSLFHQTSPRMKIVRPGDQIKILSGVSVIRDLMKQSSVYRESSISF
jgi:hypothetical protein